MRRFQVIAIALVFVSASLWAQNVNPTVQVTNDYRTQMSKVNKSGVALTVPDTLYDFDYEFDYSVFESPYKGAYEFSPYMVKMAPEIPPHNLRRLFLRAGAGYTLHPELDLVYSPLEKDKFSLNIYGNVRGFYGNYSEVDQYIEPVSKYTGHDFSDAVGIDGNVLLKNSKITFELGHNGAFASLDRWSGAVSSDALAYNSGFADFRIKSERSGDLFFYYNAGVRGRYSADSFKESDYAAKELDVTADASLGVVVKNKYRFLMDVGVEFENLQGKAPAAYNMIDLKPHAEFVLGPVNLDAGVKVDFVEGKIKVYPDVHAECSVGERHVFTVYADVTGGNDLNTYHELKMMNHRFNSSYGNVAYTQTKLKGLLGFRGYASTHFTYDLSGGYGTYDGFIMDCLRSFSELVPETGYGEGVTYAGGYRMVFADASLIWKSDRFDAMANVHFRKPLSYEALASVCELPLLGGDIRLRYNAAGRLFIWVCAGGQTDRKQNLAPGEDALPSVPAFVDLSAGCEYKFSSKIGFWVKGGNLLGQQVRMSLLYVEKSPFVTAGITLSL